MEQEFSEFRESDKSLKHELLQCVLLALCSILVFYTKGAGSNPFTVMTNILVTECETFRKNSVVLGWKYR